MLYLNGHVYIMYNYLASYKVEINEVQLIIVVRKRELKRHSRNE